MDSPAGRVGSKNSRILAGRVGSDRKIWTRVQLWLCVLHLAGEPFTARDEARYWLRITIFAYPTCIRRPPLGGGPCLNIAITFGMEKLHCVSKTYTLLFLQ